MSIPEFSVLQSVSESLARDGFAVIKNVFDPHTCNAIRENAYHLLRLTHHESTHIQWKIDEKGKYRPALYFWPSAVNPFLKDVAHSNIMQNIVQYFLGPDVFQLNNQIYFREPGDGDEFAWHQDITFRVPEEMFKNIEERYLQTALIVDPMRADNGAIEFIPGSHKDGDLHLVKRGTEAGLRKFVRGSRQGVKLEADPGDVVIWSVMVVHGSEQNKSDRKRMYYMNGFAAADSVLNKKEFPWYLKGGLDVANSVQKTFWDKSWGKRK